MKKTIKKSVKKAIKKEPPVFVEIIESERGWGRRLMKQRNSQI